MALPVQSFRALPEHRELLQAVADLLKAGHAEAVRRLVSDASAQSVGPFRSEAAALAFLRDRLVAMLEPTEIWLFGSRGRGDAKPHSDFDLLVVLRDGLPDTAYTHERVAEPLTACGLAYDVVPCRWSDFVKDRERAGSMVQRVVSEGRRIYPNRGLQYRAA